MLESLCNEALSVTNMCCCYKQCFCLFGEVIKMTLQVGPRAGPRQLQVPHPSPVFECALHLPFPLLQAAQGHSLEIECGDETTWTGHKAIPSQDPLCV